MTANPWAAPFLVGRRPDRYAYLEHRAVAQDIGGDSVLARAEVMKGRMREIFLCGSQVSSMLDHLLSLGEAHALSNYSSTQQILGALYRTDPWEDAAHPAVMLTGLAGTGKTALVQALKRLLMARVGSANLPGHKNLVIQPAWFMSLRDGNTLNSLLLPYLMSADSNGGNLEICRKKAVNQSELLRLARRISRRDGVCMICIDEFQFITRSLQANTLAVALLLQLLSIGPHVVYVANFSLARRLMDRRQEDRHRVLSNHIELRPDAAESADFLNYIEELTRVASEDFRFGAAEIAAMLHRFTFGIKRAVVELLVGAWVHCKTRRGMKADVTEADLKASYGSSGYLPFRSDVEALWRHSIGDQSIEPDLRNPLAIPPSAGEKVVVAHAAIDSFNQRVNELHVEGMLTREEREALEKINPKRGDAVGQSGIRRLPIKAASKESLLENFSRIGLDT